MCLYYSYADDFQEVLLNHIAPEHLPQALGGTRCEPDPWCTDYVRIVTYVVKKGWLIIYM